MNIQKYLPKIADESVFCPPPSRTVFFKIMWPIHLLPSAEGCQVTGCYKFRDIC